MRTNSLSFRLALIAALGSALALLSAGIVFTALFRQSVERSFDERLDVLMRALIGVSISTDGFLVDKIGLIGEPRFALPQSGWYWQVSMADSADVVAESPSLFGNDLAFPGPPPSDGEIRSESLVGPGGRNLRALQRTVAPADDLKFTILVAGDADDLTEDIARFRILVVVALGIFAALLALGTAGLVRFGLRPLRRMRAALRRVRLGEEELLAGSYPSEINPVVADLNALLTSNREIVERARTHVGNLAHALKTPLAVLRNEAGDAGGPLADKVREQTTVMQEQIDHHLNRARMAARTNVIGAITPVAETIDGLARVMRKVHQEKGLMIHVDIPDGLRFRGERQDFEEMTGNLLDNACKWAQSHVVVRAREIHDSPRETMILTVVDDGPGLTDDQMASAVSRGERIDESKPGSGLGLSIIRELVRIYDGDFTMETAKVGGLRVRLILPIATEV